MAKQKHETLFDQIRNATLNSGVSCYEIGKQTGIDTSSLSRFVNGERGLSEDAMNRLAEYLDLEIVKRQRRGRV